MEAGNSIGNRGLEFQQPFIPIENKKTGFIGRNFKINFSDTFKDKVVIVTGGASGIGKSVVLSFAAFGATVVFVDMNEAKGVKLSDRLMKESIRHLYLNGDLTKTETCKKVIDEAIAKFGRIDVLVNNAGVNDGVKISDSPDKFVESLHKNLIHYFSMTHFAFEHLKETNGNIVNISSKVSKTGQVDSCAYASAKGAINAFTRTIALDGVDNGIRVNAVVPSEVDTPQYKNWAKRVFGEDAQQKLVDIGKRIPFGKRMTTAQEIAYEVLFLASNELSGHTTGQLRTVDGGYLHLRS